MQHAYTLVIRDAHASLYDSLGASVMLIDTHVAIHVEPGYTPGPDGPRLIPALDVPHRSSNAHGGLWAGLDGLMQVQGYGVALIPTGRDAYAEALTYAQAHGATLTVRDVREALELSPEAAQAAPEAAQVAETRDALKQARKALAQALRRKSSRKALRRAQALVAQAESAYQDARDLSAHAAKLSVNQVQNEALDTGPVIVGPKGIPARLAGMRKAYEVWEHRSLWHSLLGQGLSVARPIA